MKSKSEAVRMESIYLKIVKYNNWFEKNYRMKIGKTEIRQIHI